MKLLAVAAENHDANISYWDGHQLHYYKAERGVQVKHAWFRNHQDWRNDIQRLWGIDYRLVDDMAFSTGIQQGEDTGVRFQSTSAVEYQLARTRQPWAIDRPAWLVNHHLSHSLSTWMLTDDAPDVSIVIDGVGDGYAWSVFKQHQLIDRQFVSQGSIGHEMDRVAEQMNIAAGHYTDYAGKLMGLQSYGRVDPTYLAYLQPWQMQDVKRIFSIDPWVQYKGSQLVAELTRLDWIATVHAHMAEVLVKFFKQYADPGDVIGYTGGVAQNVVWNTRLKQEFPNLIIPPHCADDGISLGAIEWLRIKHNLPKFTLADYPFIQEDQAPATYASDATIKATAELLAQGLSVGWYQGHGEIGPRALGNRSILLDPRNLDGKWQVNQIKRREDYRPFGASILAERVGDYFSSNHKDQFMLYTDKINTDQLPAITHVDGTCRVQTVDSSNPMFYKLLKEFDRLTGCPVLLNTSMNLAGKPIAAYLDTARELLYTSELDVMVLGDEIIRK